MWWYKNLEKFYEFYGIKFRKKYEFYGIKFRLILWNLISKKIYEIKFRKMLWN